MSAPRAASRAPRARAISSARYTSAPTANPMTSSGIWTAPTKTDRNPAVGRTELRYLRAVHDFQRVSRASSPEAPERAAGVDPETAAVLAALAAQAAHLSGSDRAGVFVRVGDAPDDLALA